MVRYVFLQNGSRHIETVDDVESGIEIASLHLRWDEALPVGFFDTESNSVYYYWEIKKEKALAEIRERCGLPESHEFALVHRFEMKDI
ncbi:MAG: hypothetical protein QM758_29755 [Armatimonas sp.]